MPENLEFDDILKEDVSAAQGAETEQAPSPEAVQEQAAAAETAEQQTQEPPKPKRSHHKKKPVVAPEAEQPAPSPEEKAEDGQESADKPLSILEIILHITQELVCPKDNNQIDAFTGRAWRYRNIEDIQAALKPLLAKYKAVLYVSTRPENIGRFNYITARATLVNMQGDSISTTSSAREDDTRDGNWASQISGSCDTYAKKMAIQSLFMISDAAADPDSRQCVRASGEAVCEEMPKQAMTASEENHQAEPARAEKPENESGKNLYPGHIKWMSLVAEAAQWKGTRFEFQERVKKNFLISETNLIILMASLPEEVK